ncbi:hypothetical protein UCMB321_1951 [Pseudomonas batumici]|uniref:Uncharacterized protein n=1 Tax=Pseudomonas batumici TaxID=226910 RepID=A0A0C2IHJ8_9PSED|nr:hypothetical protein UCMB321_1951 [Pseudomonas batumici]
MLFPEPDAGAGSGSLRQHGFVDYEVRNSHETNLCFCIQIKQIMFFDLCAIRRMTRFCGEGTRNL